MATYYWVGGNGTWDSVSTANWSATSGGAAGAGPPLTTDEAIFNAASGGGTCTIGTSAVCRNFNGSGSTTVLAFGTNRITCHGNATTVWIGDTTYSVSGTPVVELAYSGAVGTRGVNTRNVTEANAITFIVSAGTDILLFANNNRVRNLDLASFSGSLTVLTLTIFGDFILSSGVTLTAGGTLLNFGATSGPKAVTTAGRTLDIPVSFNGVGGSWAFQDAFTMGTARTLTLTNGILDAGANNVSIGNFALGSGTKTLTLGSGTWTVAGNWNANTNVTNLTVSASTATINMASASAKIFAGGTRSWPTLNQGGDGALTIQQSNTFANITNTVQPATVTLTAGTTQTVTDFDLSGTSGNLITLDSSTAGSSATLTDSGGVNSVSYLDIKDISATGYGEWQAYTSNGNVDSGGNIGWVFTEPSPLIASEYQISLKSFTERRRF